MQALKTVKDVATVVQAAGTVQKVIVAPQKERKQKENRNELKIRKTRQTITLLQTMLKRISLSQNQNLISDVIEMKLSEKVAKIVKSFEKNRPTSLKSDALDFIVAEIEMCHEQLKSLIMVNSVSLA
ncbi:hypothetical protein B9Z55_017443 [Caenorhabditis nigoni]|uniref:Uncharacterized protein n=1 Tax=Caenorhabditis nigoni TaxID=1611254 RepID=A0A2G5T9Q1_9PELO|nr:hypothetical protein B9Z55_017443 [Caenorhabditis nigoni]